MPFATTLPPSPGLRSRSGAGLRSGVAGYALIVALIALVVASLAVTVAVGSEQFDARRARESQLLWAGNQYRLALRSYAAAIPQGGKSQYPLKLEDLLEDGRFPNPVRHLRQLFADPITGKTDWVVEQVGGRIVGVHSRSNAAPLRHGGFGLADAGFAGAKTYADWHFLVSDAVDVVSAIPTLTSTPAVPIPLSDTAPVEPPPPAPPDPNGEARGQCFALYGAPMLRCKGPDYPMGHDGPSCRKAYADLLDECLAPIGGR